MERRGRRSPDRERGERGDRHGRRYEGEGFGSDRRERRYDSGDDFDRGDRRFFQREEGRDFRRENVGRRGDGAAAASQELPELYSICRGRVHSVKPFGLFVRLEGYRAHGLVHLSQVSNHEVTQREDSDEVKMQALAAIAGQGEEIWVKIIAVRREEDGSVKIGCSMKLVGQTDGRDLDPNNLQAELNESRPSRPARSKVTLDAVYNVSCSRCGGHGHLKSECYATGDKTYELLPEEALEDPVPQPSTVLAEETLDKEKNRHSASKSSKKRSHLPDSVTTVEEAKALIASLKDEKKKKKEKRESKRHHSKHHKKRRKEEESAH
ncbi:nucleolar protein of 40 kDa [Selaginella moellendorffii]|uniref:nucleolar protein of 40 kDa n=1 Tax=Selaginella moellendorffii TaxID=88036 RepID=UPI000D1CD395|nr:nucleolar protein of 40 kDa [Selaginella moellendorffii]|eukprot:XP_024543783.1 nucleolar protein of 40 kDa [Selaginella moellendorffii]